MNRQELTDRIVRNIESAVNCRGWDSYEGTPDYLLALWIMDYRPVESCTGDVLVCGPSIREILEGLTL